jgi:O-antigen biosynthesis protein WbqV
VLGLRDRDDKGKLYVLDMGEPVRIIDLARQMILLAGLRPDIDIRIEISGPRPGEKLFEEILHDSEPPVPTSYAGILLAAPRVADHAILARAIDEITTIARGGDKMETVAQIARLIPEYKQPDADVMRAAAS